MAKLNMDEAEQQKLFLAEEEQKKEAAKQFAQKKS